MVSKQDAINQVEKRINEPDMDWPTKPKQLVFDELTREETDGWLFYFGIPEDMRMPGRDPEPQDNVPWFVNRATGEMSQSTS